MTNGQSTTAGWTLFIAALGLMCGLLSVDVASLKSWNEAMTPLFIGSAMGHLGVVIASFVGGKLIPEERSGKMTRASDSTIIPTTALKGRDRW